MILPESCAESEYVSHAYTAKFILNQNWNGSDQPNGYAYICKVSFTSLT